ncbi:MAG TPA: DUF933 domain-containing protein, partial [Opitutales bacterium]|nr:DUF933 domain-containing protein [Opitutales bacterium]
AQDKDALALVAILEQVIPHLNAGKPALTLDLGEEDAPKMKLLGLLSAKPVLYACNVAEEHMANPDTNPFVKRVHEYVSTHHGAGIAVICAKLEAELCDLTAEEAQSFLDDMGVKGSGVSELIRATYDLLGLASYFTAGEKEVHAWTFIKGMKAPACAGVIHTDFERGFIKAEVVSYPDLVAAGSIAAAREAGKYRLEGKEYAFKDGDVALFKFNV